MRIIKYSVFVAFGSDVVRKINNNDILTKEEKELNIKKYVFNTENERKAFIKGIEEANGWLELIYFEKMEKISVENRLTPTTS